MHNIHAANSAVQPFSISELNMAYLAFWRHMFFLTFILVYIEIYV